MSIGLVLKGGAAPVAPPVGYVRLFIDQADGNLYVQDSNNVVTKAIAASGSDDMTKAVYDTGDDGRVDNAEQLNDGTNVTTAAQARTHLDSTANPHGVTAAQVGAVTQIPIIIACSDETTDLTTGVAKVTFRMPFAGTLDSVKADLTEAATGSGITVDINEAGTSVLSTLLTIDATEDTSATAATPPVISDSALANNAKMTIDLAAVGSTTPGKGLKVTLMVTPS